MSPDGALPHSPAKRWALPTALLLSALLVGALQLSTIDIGLHMADEGFLWYGVQRVIAGDVPLRDFQAYDPGRYYWCALLAGPSGAGIVAVRWAVALFGAAGLVLALLVAARFARGPSGLVPCALVLVLWMFPRHKLFEPALLAATLWVGVRLVERPSLGRHVAAGVLAGAAGFVGRNLALYATVGLGLLALHLALRRHAGERWKPLLAFAAAVPAGYAPVLGMMAFVPGFGAAVVDSLELQTRHGANLPLPYPWPWRTDWSALDGWILWGNIALAAFFLLPWAVLPLGLAELVRARGPARVASERAVPVAAGVVGLVALHHVSVRSDAPHLAQCSWPILLLALELSSRWRPVARHAAWGGLALASLLAALVSNTQLSRFRPDVQRTLVDHPVGGDVLRLSVGQDRDLGRIERLFAKHVPADARVWIVNRPTLYPLLARTAPLWWLHLYFEATEEEQGALIRELDERRIDWVLIVAEGEEGLEERLFPETHARVWQHLLEGFDRLADDALPAGHYFFRRRA